MESYCVIHFKDTNEKKQVVTMLLDTRVDFDVTTDLKKFVAEKFDVTILENVVVTSSTVDTNQSAPIVADQPTPVINTRNFMNMDDYGTYVPYLERPVEPKEEDVDDTATVVDNGNRQDTSDIQEDIGVEEFEEEVIDNTNNVGLIENDDILEPSQMNIPSSSTTRRSGRVTKKPRYSTDEDSDDENDVEYEPTTVDSDEEYTRRYKYPRRTDQTSKKVTIKVAKPKKVECNKCDTEVDNNYYAKERHVIIHTDIARYECMVEGCGFKCISKKGWGSIKMHLKKKHAIHTEYFREIELNNQQKEDMEKIRNECFDR